MGELKGRDNIILLSDYHREILKKFVNYYKESNNNKIKYSNFSLIFNATAKDVKLMDAIAWLQENNLSGTQRSSDDGQMYIYLTSLGRNYFEIEELEIEQRKKEDEKRKEELRIAELKESKANRRTWLQMFISIIISTLLSSGLSLLVIYIAFTNGWNP